MRRVFHLTNSPDSQGIKEEAMKPSYRIRTLFRHPAPVSMSMRRAWYAETPETPNKTDSTTETPDTPPGTNGGNGTTFTQADLDRYAGNARKEARNAAQKQFLEDLGIDSLDTLKTVLANEKKRQDAELSETQKLQQQIAAEQKKTADAIAAKDALEKQVLERDRKAEFVKAAQKGGGSAVEDLFILVQAKRGSDFEQVFKEGAQPDDAKMTAFIKQVQADHPNYFGSAGAGSPSNAGGTAPTVTKATEDAKKDIEKKFGRM